MSEETGTKILTDEDKRKALREKIAASETRNADRTLAEQAQAAANDALDFVRANPLKTVGAVAIGALIIGALTRPGRELGRKAGNMAGFAADAALAYALSMKEAAGDAAEAGEDVLSEFGHTAAAKARKWQGLAAKEMDGLGTYLTANAKRGRHKAKKSASRLHRRFGS